MLQNHRIPINILVQIWKQSLDWYIYSRGHKLWDTYPSTFEPHQWVSLGFVTIIQIPSFRISAFKLMYHSAPKERFRHCCCSAVFCGHARSTLNVDFFRIL
jgi:hypothetical protein